MNDDEFATAISDITSTATKGLTPEDINQMLQVDVGDERVEISGTLEDPHIAKIIADLPEEFRTEALRTYLSSGVDILKEFGTTRAEDLHTFIGALTTDKLRSIANHSQQAGYERTLPATITDQLSPDLIHLVFNWMPIGDHRRVQIMTGINGSSEPVPQYLDLSLKDFTEITTMNCDMCNIALTSAENTRIFTARNYRRAGVNYRTDNWATCPPCTDILAAHDIHALIETAMKADEERLQSMGQQIVDRQEFIRFHTQEMQNVLEHLDGQGPRTISDVEWIAALHDKVKNPDQRVSFDRDQRNEDLVLGDKALANWHQALDLQTTLAEFWLSPDGHISGNRIQKAHNLSDDSDVADLQARVCKTAPTYWVSPDMMALWLKLAPSLPSQSLSFEDLPTTSGFVVFSRPIQSEGFFDLAGFTWMVQGNQVDISWYIPNPGDRKLPVTSAPLLLATPISWRFGTTDPSYYGVSTPMGRLTDTFWALCNQKAVVVAQAANTRPARKRAERVGLDPLEISRVSVVDLRRVKHEPSGDHHEGNWTHRWWVNPFWRNQPTSEGYKRILINGYVKGPEGLPFVPKQKVYRVVR